MNLPGTDGAFRGAGNGGYGWSLRMNKLASAYYLDFYATGVYPSHGPNNRWHGFPLRCLSTVLDM